MYSNQESEETSNQSLQIIKVCIESWKRLKCKWAIDRSKSEDQARLQSMMQWPQCMFLSGQVQGLSMNIYGWTCVHCRQSNIKCVATNMEVFSHYGSIHRYWFVSMEFCGAPYKTNAVFANYLVATIVWLSFLCWFKQWLLKYQLLLHS